MVNLSLTKTNRLLIGRAFSRVPRVDMSIDCIIEGQMGQAAADDARSPTVFKLEVGPFRYFAGDPQSDAGQALLGTLKPYRLIMPSFPGWINALQAKHGEKLECIDRFQFSSDTLSIDQIDAVVKRHPHQLGVKRIDLAFAKRVWDSNHFVDLSDYDSPEDFVARGIGFYIEKEGNAVGAAYSSLVCSRGIEVSVFVQENFRQQGIASAVSAHLLKWSLEQNLEPNWDAANSNSCALAEKLGYEAVGSYKAFYLKE